MKRATVPKVPSLDSALQNVALLADSTWVFDECFDDEFKQNNLELWIEFKEVEELAKNNQNAFTVPTHDFGNGNYTCDKKLEYQFKSNHLSNKSDENITEPAYTSQYSSENENPSFENLTIPVPERLHSKMKFAQSVPSLPLPPASQPEAECNHCSSSKKWLSSLPWTSLLIKNFPSLPEIIPERNSLYIEDGSKKRRDLDTKKYPPPHYTIKTSEEFKLHMAITSQKVKALWDDSPLTPGRTLEDIFNSQRPQTSAELDCDIPEFYPRSWQTFSNSCLPVPVSYVDHETMSHNTEYLEGSSSQMNLQPEDLPIQHMETKYDDSFGILDQQSIIEPSNLIKMVEYSGWPVIDAISLDEMNTSVARLYPEREKLFCEMVSVVDTVYNFIEDGFISQTNMNNNQLVCYPETHSEVEEGRDEENTFDQLEKEALEQYQASDHHLMTIQNSDESINKKFQDLEKEAMEQYNTSETIEEEFRDETKDETETVTREDEGAGPPSNAKARGKKLHRCQLS